MYFSIFIVGVIGITAQAAYLREILATFRGGELTIGTALLFWLLWTSVGSSIVGRFVSRASEKTGLFHTILPWYGIFGYLGITLIRCMPFLARLSPGELVPYDLQLIATSFVFMPFNILGGVLFTLGVKALERNNSPSAGRTFTLEAFGAAVGGVIVSIVLVKFLSNNSIAFLCPVIGIFVSAVWGIGHRLKVSLLWITLSLILFAAVFSLNKHGSHYQYRGQKLLQERDTKYGRLLVTKRGEQTTFYSDASTLFSAPDPETSEYIVHIPMLAAQKPRRVLVLGGGPGGLIDEVLKYKTVTRVTCVELNPGLFELSKRFLYEKWADDPRVKIVIDDGLAFLQNSTELFDVILMNMPEPLAGVTNRYYTYEFFKLCASRMSAPGIISFTLLGAENYIPDDLAFFLASIRTTLRSVFPSTTTLPGLKCRFLASNSPGFVDSLRWESMIIKRKKIGIETSYFRDYFLRFIMSSERVKFLTESLDIVPSPAVNSDTRPSAYFSRTVVQGNLDGSRIVRFIKPIARPRFLTFFMIIGIAVTALFVLIPGPAATERKHGEKETLRRRVIATVMSVGLTEISLEVLAIIAYQSIFGFLYGRIALLTGSYMAGLAAGALAGTRTVDKGCAGTKLLGSIQAFIAIIPLLWALILVINSSFRGRIPGLEVCFYILTALSGLAGGFQFPVADSLYRTSLIDRSKGLGTIYGVDLAGSSVGALLTASLMIPILGMLPVLGFLAALNIITAVVLLFSR